MELIGILEKLNSFSGRAEIRYCISTHLHPDQSKGCEQARGEPMSMRSDDENGRLNDALPPVIFTVALTLSVQCAGSLT